MSETIAQPEAQSPAPAPEQTKEQPKPLGQAALDKAKLSQQEAIAKAEVANAKIKARADELRKFIGKTYQPLLPTRGENQSLKIVSYEGINVIPDGQPGAGGLAHMFRVESKAPEYIHVTPASQFLQEHQEIAVEETAQSQEII